MPLRGVPVPGKMKSSRLISAFIRGAKAAGGRRANAWVFFGVTDKIAEKFDEVKAKGDDYYYGDNSYFDRMRGKMFRFTKNAVQVACRHNLEHRTSTRWGKLGIYVWGPRVLTPVPPCKCSECSKTAYTLVVEQSANFMRHVAKAPNYFAEVRAGYDRIRWRPWTREKAAICRTLDYDLQGANQVVTWSSSAAIEASLRGIPIVVSPMSAFYGLEWEQREKAAALLADNQWTLGELRSGTAWRMLQENRLWV